ncbi:hypothetical protein BLA24_08545 [Streptomyces cinnamoneus]|uniref:Uncharacterized protein n=1 Tax=Streptomyces cinnamoneus TaxID=53446 RepID=A0A2G1XLT9_STRCJ|nr:DUF6643 family protein [Streptomyces cinnamoneus]PHQ52208.1 hypothetical protein BLA24_08545 [Streptomyces cinnamoneus]PPT12141.1 hypothetical protein CYQ11_03800 [Streptomyces cinnamoneus]
MTSPRSTYGGGYYASSSFPDTPIYDSLVAERGTPQIAPIRVSSPYDFGGGHLGGGGNPGGGNLPALPALPSGPSSHPAPQAQQHGYAAQAQQYGGQPAPAQPMGLQQAHAPHIPQQGAPRGYAGPPQQQRPAAAPAGPAGYDAMRPAAPRPSGQYEDPYGNRPYDQGGY